MPDPEHELVTDVQRSVMQSRMLCYQELTYQNQIPDDLHRQLAVCVMQYVDVLPLEQTQSIDEVAEVRSVMGRTQPFEVEAPGDTSNTTTELRPAVLSISPERLIRISKRLDEVAADLGFGPGADIDADQGLIR